MKKWLSGLVVIAVLILMTWIASPYWMLYQLKQAYQQQQPEKISSYVDYQQVRSSLKPQIEKALLLHLQTGKKQESQGWYGIIRGILDTQISQKILDTFVSEKMIQLLMQGKQLSEMIPHFEEKQERRSAQNMLQANSIIYKNEQSEKKDHKVSYQAHYLSPNRFAVALTRQDGKQTKFIFNRHGWQWKMTSIDLGLD